MMVNLLPLPMGGILKRFGGLVRRRRAIAEISTPRGLLPSSGSLMSVFHAVLPIVIVSIMAYFFVH